jgi:hypothetical protein
MLISFSQWVQENKSNPNFAQMFSEKVPYYYTFEGKRVGAIHDTDWYNEYNVPNPLKNDVAYKNSIVWQQAVEAGKEAERKLRKAIENGLTEVTASKPATVKYHTLDPLGGEPLLTLRESNPQGIVVVQRGTDNLISSLPQNLRKDFEQGRKKIVNKTEDSKGAINASTSGIFCQGFSTICPYWLDIGPLVVELTLFEATVYNGYVDINWITASETNSHYFTLYKSDGFTDFKPIDKIDAAGYSNSIKEYNYRDNSPLEGNIYYKLVETDLNGIKHEYNIINVYNPYRLEFQVYDQLGRPTDLNTRGFKIIRYEIRILPSWT